MSPSFRADPGCPLSGERRLFHDPAADAAARVRERALLPLLLAQDGSTTRLCEVIAGGPIQLQVLEQTVTSQVPAIVRELLPGRSFVERYSTLSAGTRVMMDNLSYIARDALDTRLSRALEGGTIPIGHLIESVCVRRRFLDAATAQPLHERLWARVGLPDPSAARAYSIATPEGPLFIIAETFRRGMQRDPGVV